ncbi:MAG: type II toxin-antitoxin system HicB family antitoxin [Verrucomicrobia bacterium]|jgi:predicted RNase H-like HicB family nuclease|nr:type II toxin-antitoxin system HicB family antitoxin [Verrucomicrobiota bacterium]MCH8528135.1 type II toxin-antitoxin system HicB family antitoxin [Kiritimatiellia bacterium]
MKLKIIVHKAEEGGFWAEVPALPGCVSQGETMVEVRDNIREAIELWLETGEDQPFDQHESEVLEMAV